LEIIARKNWSYEKDYKSPLSRLLSTNRSTGGTAPEMCKDAQDKLKGGYQTHLV
jgi:hypothetical protein